MITVCIITYNQENWIRQTLDSILTQKTEYPFEVIIGEDWGADGTRAICEEYAAKYDNVRMAVSEHNLGVTANWVNCIHQGSGKYIMSCAGDDFWHNPNKIQLQVDFMEAHPKCVICHTDIDEFNVKTGGLTPNYKQKSGIIPPEGYIQKEVLQGKEFVSAVTMCIRRDMFERFIPVDKYIELGFPREDWPTLLILSAYGEVRYLPVSTATYRVGQESITRTSDYDKIIRRAQQDKLMTEYLYTLFPEWGPFEDGPYFDNIGYHNALLAAYRNKDYESAHEFAKKDKFSSWAKHMACTKSTFELFRWIRIIRGKL